MSLSSTGKTQIEKNLLKKGYILTDIIAKTLQGYIFLAKHKTTKTKVIIKGTSMLLHSKNIAILNDNKPIIVEENIIKEAALMKFLHEKANLTPKGFIRCIDFFNDGKLYYLIMDYGGISLHKYVLDNISKLNNKKLSIIGWRQHVQRLFKQMCIYVKFLHDNNVCHLDISLENCTIKDNIVYFCDFGLSEYFRNNDFKCNKFCGKLSYQSPEIYNKCKYYNATKSDLWSMGVILFLMHTGVPLYKFPSIKDPYFCNVINEFTQKMVNAWKMDNYVPTIVYNLLHCIIKPETERYTMKQILNHVYLK